jgi:tetratricopeptide (TPR) repeat protein
MLSFSKRFIYILSNKIRRKNLLNSRQNKLIFDFSKTSKSPFDIKPESSYNAYLSKNAFTMELLKPNCIAWVEIPDYEFQDHSIEARIRLDSLGGYASTGFLFHAADSDSYYMTLISSKGYFRLDAVKNNSPKTLIAWTEIPYFDGTNINLNIITYGTYIILIINSKWAGSASDGSISGGRLAFALASYSANDEQETEKEECVCKAYLDYLSVDLRIKTLEEDYKKWTEDSNINADSRLLLAETFAVMGDAAKALDQIYRAWKRRDEAVLGVYSNDTGVRTKKELLLAARMAFSLGQYREAEEYIDAILEQWINSTEGKEAVSEKIKILNELDKFAELKEFALKHSKSTGKDINYYCLLARSYHELKEYKNSADAWNSAFEMDPENGVYAVNAASALELAGRKEEAIARFIDAGNIFLKQDNVSELAVMMPKLSELGGKNWEARALAGKWAYSIENYDQCEKEFINAEKLRRAHKPKVKPDPALYYLWGLILNLKNKNQEAVQLLEKAVKLAPDYGLFRFKLVEFKITDGQRDPKFAKELQLALELIGDDPEGEMSNHAGNLLVKAGDQENAKIFFDQAYNRS